jgi:hypothetical protein
MSVTPLGTAWASGGRGADHRATCSPLGKPHGNRPVFIPGCTVFIIVNTTILTIKAAEWWPGMQ